MSKLQTALHAMPQGSIVTADLMASTRALNARMDSITQDETVSAKRIQQETGCSWPEALRSAAPNPVPNTPS